MYLKLILNNNLSMLHELLFALRGNFGGLFVEKSDGAIQVCI